MLHIFVLVDATLRVAVANLPKRLVLVAARSAILHVKNVVIGGRMVVFN